MESDRIRAADGATECVSAVRGKYRSAHADDRGHIEGCGRDVSRGVDHRGDGTCGEKQQTQLEILRSDFEEMER